MFVDHRIHFDNFKAEQAAVVGDDLHRQVRLAQKPLGLAGMKGLSCFIAMIIAPWGKNALATEQLGARGGPCNPCRELPLEKPYKSAIFMKFRTAKIVKSINFPGIALLST